jgi:hypothetical protein
MSVSGRQVEAPKDVFGCRTMMSMGSIRPLEVRLGSSSEGQTSQWKSKTQLSSLHFARRVIPPEFLEEKLCGCGW